MNSPPAEPTARPLRTLRRRLLLLLLLPLAAVLLVSVTVDYRIAFEPAAEAYDHSLMDDVVALAGRVHVKGEALEIDLPPTVEEVLRNDQSDQEFLSVFGPGGRCLAGDTDLLPDTVSPARNPALTDAEFRGKKIRKASYLIDTAAGPVTITVAETTSKRERAGSKILVAMILPNVILIMATLALVYLGIRSGLAPLTHLGHEISRRSPHDLSPFPRGDVPAEAEPLIKAMDGLVDDLRTAATAQQAFLANAAHQLKTPLAGLQTQLELTLQEIPGEYRNRVLNLRDATQRLGHLAHQLLALARSAPEVNLTGEKRPVDLARLLEASASSWFDMALAKEIDLGFEPGEAVIEGSEWLLREMLANLIENALRYTPPGGKVTARSGLDLSGRPFIEVEDNGPGIPDDERQRIFERFYRGEANPAPGTGLGLSIVKEVADRHHATVHLTGASNGTGTCFRVDFASGCRPAAAQGTTDG